MNEEILTEEWCEGCDEVVHAIFKKEDFESGKVGRIRCPVCGNIISPCVLCSRTDECDNCPYKNSEVVESLTDEEYVLWEKENTPKFYELKKSGEMGEYWEDLIKDLEKNNTTTP